MLKDIDAEWLHNNAKNKNIILFGASLTGCKIHKLLKIMNLNVVAFVDNMVEKQGLEYDGIMVISPDKIRKEDIVVITSSLVYVDIIAKQLEALKIENVYYLRNESKILKYIDYYVERDNGEYKEEVFEEMYQTISKRCSKIKIYFVESARMGESIPKMMRIKRQGIEDEFYLIMPWVLAGDLANRRLFEIYLRKYNMINFNNAKQWEYILNHHSTFFDFSECDKYDLCRDERHGMKLEIGEHEIEFRKLEIGEHEIEFTKEEIVEAEEKFKKLGIKSDYVCMMKRDSAYLASKMDEDQKSLWDYHDYRDSDILKCKKAAEYLQNLGIEVVRVGQVTKECLSEKWIVDFPNTSYDELLDLYLSMNCMFWVGDTCGANVIPGLFGKPRLSLNLGPLLCGWYLEFYSEADFYMPKLWMNATTKKYLTLKEMLEISMESWFFMTEDYEKYNIIPIENTEEDILEGVKEMYARLNGDWQQETNELYGRYLEILDDHCKKHTWHKFENQEMERCIPTYRILDSFLNRHPFWLE